MSDKLFTAFKKEHRPLRTLLEQRSRPALMAANALTRDQTTSSTTDELVAELLDSWVTFAQPVVRTDPPMLVAGEPWHTHRRSDDNGDGQPYWRWFYRFQLVGNIELLDYWPERLELDPCESDLHTEPAPEFMWVWSAKKPGVSAMIDVAQVDDPVGSTPPSMRALAATHYLDAALAAANAELTAFDTELRTRVYTAIRERRDRLGVIAQRNVETIELIAREAPALEIVDLRPPPTDSSPAHTAPRVHIDDQDIALDLAVTEATFSNVLDICQQWTESAQSYPSAFKGLNEDSITSLFVTTLNVVFDTAHREVFKGKGKTDIYIELSRDDRSRAAYIGEAKFWDGPKEVANHVNQLLGYSVEHLREVVLIYYVRKKRIDVIKRNARRAIGNLTLSCVWENGSRLIAQMRHPNFGYSLNVAVLFVHLPPGGG